MYAAVGALARGANAGLPTAIILGVLAAGGSASDASIMVAALTAVAGIGGPFIGAAADRLESPKRGYVLATLLLGVVAALLAIGIGSWPAGALVLVAGLGGLAHPMLTGAWSAQLRRIVPDVAPARAYAIDVGTYNFGDIMGPAIVGIAYVYDAATPGSSALEVVLLLYIGTAIALAFVPIPLRSETHEVAPQPLMRTMRGLTIFWHSVSLRRSTIISTVGFCAIAGVVIGAPLLGADLAGDPGVGALMLAVVAAGALVGSLIFARRPIHRIGPGTLVVVSTLILALLMGGLAAAPSMSVAFPLAFLIGVAEAPQLTAVMQVRDRESPAHVRGLVFVAAASMKTGAFALGALVAAALATGGWRVLLVGSAVIEVVSVVLGLLIAGHRHPQPPSPPNIVGGSAANAEEGSEEGSNG